MSNIFASIAGSAAVVLIIALAACFSLFWVWAIVDCARRTFPQDSTKIGWILAILFLHFLGALLYVIFGRPAGVLPGECGVSRDRPY